MHVTIHSDFCARRDRCLRGAVPYVPDGPDQVVVATRGYPAVGPRCLGPIRSHPPMQTIGLVGGVSCAARIVGGGAAAQRAATPIRCAAVFRPLSGSL